MASTKGLTMRLSGCYRTVLFMLFGFCHLLYSGELTIAVAANARYAAAEIAQQFEEETDISCRLVIASSGKLSAQIRNGAPFHIFLSADTTYPAALIKDQFAESPLLIYAHGTLVIWSKAASDSSSLNTILNNPDSRIAIANPRTAPYGFAALEAWESLFPNQNSRKFIYGSSISQVNQYVQSEATDAGFTSKSTIFHLNREDRGYWEEVPEKLHPPLAQGAILLAAVSESERKSAERFLKFLTEPKAIRILQTYGYRIE